MSSKSAFSIRLFAGKTLAATAFMLASLATFGQVAKAPSLPVGKASAAVEAAKMSATFSRLPLAFEANSGQSDPRVKFLSRGPGYGLFLTKNEAVLSLTADKSGHYTDIVRLKIAGARSDAPVAGLDALPGKTNYFIGKDQAKWHTNITNYSKVRYTSVYPGIDLLYYGNQQQLEHDFIVAPGGDPKKIALQISGAKRLDINSAGDLVLGTNNGELRFKKPLIYQEKNGSRLEIAGGYQLNKHNRVSFQVGEYDRTRELIIDPVLNYSTYLTAPATVLANAIAVDSSSNAYITGSLSAGTSFPPTAATVCATCGAGGAGDIFVAKLNATGTALTFLSIIGGTLSDTGNAIALDTASPPNVFVTGQTSSTDFPTTTNAFKTTAGNNAPDAYAFKLQSDGAALLYATYLNGGAAATDGADIGTGIAVGPNGNIYVTGSTASTTFLPASFGAGIQTANADNTGATTDAFLMKLNPVGTGAADLLYGTYWGGTVNEVANAIALLASDKVYIAGFTTSTANYPTTGGAVQTTFRGTQDGFIASINTNSAVVSSATCINATTTNTVEFVTASAHGLVSGDSFIISGVANSTGSTTIVFNGTHTATAGTTGTKIHYTTTNCKGSTNTDTGATTAASLVIGSLKYSTLMGGNLVDEVKAIALDGSGNIYATGSTNSTTSFPNGANSIQAGGLNTTASGANTDAFVAKLNAAGTTLTYSAYLGGTGVEEGTSIAVNKLCTASCEAYIAGSTTTGSGFFNINALQGAFGGVQDGFVARVNGAGNALIYSTYFGGAGTDAITGLAATYVTTAAATNTLYLAGNTNGAIGSAGSFGSAASVTSSAFQTVTDAASTGSAFVAQLSASNTAMPSLGISGNKNLDPIGQSAASTSAVTYTWTVTNTNAAKSVTVDIPLPQTGGADLLTISGSPVLGGTGAAGSCTKKVGSATSPGGLTCNLGDLTAGGSSTIVVSAAPTVAAHCDNAPCTAITQTGKVASAETNSLVTSGVLNSNVAPVTNLVVTGTAVSNVTTGAVYKQGVDTSLVYNITVTNNSGLTVAANSAGLDVLIESDYPANFAVTGVVLNGNPIVLAALAQGTEGCFDDNVTHKIQCNVLSIAAGGTATMAVTGAFSAAPSNPALGNLITTSKFPASDTSEIFTANGSNSNVAIAVDYSGPIADLDVTVNSGLIDSPDPVRGSQTLTYTVNYQNIGPTDATNVKITQSFAPGVVQTAKFTATTKPAFCAQASPGANVICAIPDANVSGVNVGVPQSFTISGSAPLDPTIATDPTFGSTVTISTTGNTTEPVGGSVNNTSSGTTVIRREGKLSVDTLTAPVASSNGPTTFQFTFNAANAGLDNATNTHVIFSLPQNVNAISISPGTCTGANTTTPDCNIGTVAAGASVPVTVTVTPAALGAGVQSSNFSTSITNITSAEVVDLTPGVSKTDGPRVTAIQRQTSLTIAMVQTSPAASGPISTDDTVAAGQVTYRATINNTGADTGTNVKVGFLLPTNFILKTAPANAGGTCAINAVPAPAAGVSRLECTIASVPTGSTFVDLVVAAPTTLVPSNASSAAMDAVAELDLSKSTEIIDNHGTVTLTSTPTVTTTVERRADLHMLSSSATTAVSSDGDITHSIQVISNGATATNVSVLLTFDHNYRFQSSNSASGLGAPVCNVTFTATTRTCTLPDLPTGTPYTFNVIVKPEANIVQTNAPATNKTNVNLLSATISASVVQNPNTQPDTTTSAAVTEVRRQANLVAANGLTPVSQTVSSGNPVSYALVVSNQGPDADVGATVTFTFTANAQNFTAFDGSLSGAIGTGLGTCTPNAAAGTVSCVVADLANPFPSGATRTGTIKFTPPALTGGATSASFTGSALVQSALAYDDGVNGATSSNNTSNTVTTTVQTQSDLQVQSVVASSPNLASPVSGNVADGAPLQYTVNFTNVGDTAGTGANPVILSHVLPDDFISSTHYGFTVTGATWSSSLGSPGSCTLTGLFAPAAAVTCQSTSGSIANGEVITVVESGSASIAPTQTSFAFTDTAKIPTSSAGYNDPISGNNQASATTFQVVRTADLGVVQSGGIVVRPIIASSGLPDSPGATFEVTKHNAIQYDITVQNLSLSSSVSNVLVDAVLPATPITTALTFTSGTNCSVIAAGPPQTVRCTIPAPLGPVGSGTDMATVSFILTPSGTLPSNTPSVQLSFNPSVSASGNTDTNPANNGNIPAAITINRDSDLGITITGPATPVTVTSPTPGVTPTFTYTITATNFGPSVATTVRVQDLLPTADLTFVSGSWPTVGSTTAGTCVAGTGNAINCDMASMDVGAVVPITLTVRPILAVSVANKSAIINPVTISSNNVNDSNTNVNTDSWPVDLRGRADLSVQITPTPVPQPGAHINISANGTASHALVGDRVSYDVKITNAGPYPAGSQITLTDTPDARVALLSAADISGTGFNCAGAVCTASALPVNGVADIVFVTDVPPSVVPAGQKTTLTNSAVVTQYTNGTTLANDITDPNTANNAASTPTIIADAAEDLLVSQTAPSSVLTAALTTPNTAVFTVTAANNQDVSGGRSQATNVRITNVVTISPNNSVPSITVPAGCSTTAVAAFNASSDRATVTCNIAGSIASGSSASVSFSMTPTKSGTITNSPTLTSTTATSGTTVEVDPDTTNNTLTAAAIAASTITVNNTPPGPQSIHPVDPVTGISNPNVLINFPFVNTSGSSFVTVTPTGTALNANLLPVTQYINIWSAAVSTPPITVCVNYTTSFLNPERVRLIYANSGSTDITSSLDQVAKIVCGRIPNNQQLPTTQANAASLVVTEPRNTPPHTTAGKLAPSAAPSQQSSGKGVTGTSVSLTSNIEDSDINQGCFTPVGSAAGTANTCSDVLTFTWNGQFTDGTVKTFTCAAPYTSACQSLDVSVTTTSQILTLTVTDQTGDATTGVLGPINVPLSATSSGGGGGATSITVNKGQTATFANVITVTYTGVTPLTLSFTGTPGLTANQITCSASPASLAGPVVNQAVTVLCSTQGQVFAMSAPPSHNSGRGDAPILASVAGLSSLPLVGLLLLPGRARRKKYVKLWAIFGLLLLMVVFQASCGGGGGSSSFGGAPVLQNAGTPSGTYLVTVNPAPGLTVSGGSLTLIVQ